MKKDELASRLRQIAHAIETGQQPGVITDTIWFSDIETVVDALRGLAYMVQGKNCYGHPLPATGPFCPLCEAYTGEETHEPVTDRALRLLVQSVVGSKSEAIDSLVSVDLHFDFPAVAKRTITIMRPIGLGPLAPVPGRVPRFGGGSGGASGGGSGGASGSGDGGGGSGGAPVVSATAFGGDRPNLGRRGRWTTENATDELLSVVRSICRIAGAKVVSEVHVGDSVDLYIEHESLDIVPPGEFAPPIAIEMRDNGIWFTKRA